MLGGVPLSHDFMATQLLAQSSNEGALVGGGQWWMLKFSALHTVFQMLTCVRMRLWVFVQGRVRTKTVKKAARVLVEKYYIRLTHDFQTNKKIAEEVAIIPSKRLRNKIAGFATVRLVWKTLAGSL